MAKRFGAASSPRDGSSVGELAVPDLKKKPGGAPPVRAITRADETGAPRSACFTYFVAALGGVATGAGAAGLAAGEA
jgi:hypothetical protein